ncbi:hypothetical protein [Paenibacillus sp. Root444D2]|uniref:hypothetical protein n=1 Tax=Paenibacillus sp. Root444D2 TaxID=1736538 RepID=UPI00070E98B2|nr:hypothetical protein [Paenibacillus sp. Root444D2]KQX69250.1 hypothetical protein ASD40_01750 [Paenibacillus sp. Root444D2]
MARIKRQVLDPEQVRGYIKEHMKFVMINNRIFDDFYENRELYYHPLKDEMYIDRNTKIETNFSDLDMVIFIFIHLLQLNKITLYEKEMAAYLGCHERYLKESIKKINLIRGNVKAQYNPHRDIIDILSEPKEVSLINYKMDRKGRRSKSPVPEWYVDFIPDHKKTKEGTTPINFFAVTIDDLDLLTKGYLTRPEFILYLFFIRIHKEKSEQQKPFNLRNSTIAERLQIKGADTTLNKYIDKLESLGLIQINYPKNYDDKLMFRQEPSREFIPIANLAYMEQYRVEEQIDELAVHEFS